jgi:beta-lactam-binding protein with PASTA domain
MAPLLPSQAVFRQKPWLPWWLVPVVIALAALAVMLYLLLPKNEVVPKVIGAKSAFAAEKALTKANLKLNPDKKTAVSTKFAPGTVIAQDPAPGKKAKKDSAVSIVTAVGTGRIKVPDLKAKTVTDAEKALRAAKLTLGQANPQPNDPAKFLVKSQIPAAGEVAKEGEPVNVFLIKAPVPKAKDKNNPKAKAAANAAAVAAATKGTGNADITVPAVNGAKLDDYAAQLGKLKLVPQKKLAYDASKPGTVFKTVPAAGQKAKAGQNVTMFVSGGFPNVAYDDDKDILVRNGATGKLLKPIATSSRIEKDPTFSDDGTHLAYQAANQVFLADLTKPDSAPTPTTAKGDFFSDLQFAPTPETNLLAMLRDNADNSSQLCLQVIAKTTQAPQCLSKPPGGIVLARKINWSPDGKQMLVWGYVPNPAGATLIPNKLGMVRYRSSKPFSPDSKDWHTSGFVTDTTNKGKGVLDAAFSPDGKQVAVISNLNDAGDFRLSMDKPNDLLTLSKATALGITACKVIWRPDGIDVAIIRADDCLGSATGQLVRMSVANPKADQDQLALVADNPTFQPLQLGG